MATPQALNQNSVTCERAVDLIEEQTEGLLTRGETATLTAWGKALPTAVLVDHPPLSLYLASALLIAGDIDLGLKLLDLAEARLVEATSALRPEARTTLRSRADAIRSLVTASQGNLARAIELACGALAQLASEGSAGRQFAECLERCSNAPGGRRVGRGTHERAGLWECHLA